MVLEQFCFVFVVLSHGRELESYVALVHFAQLRCAEFVTIASEVPSAILWAHTTPNTARIPLLN